MVRGATLLVLGSLVVALGAGGYVAMIRMPGASYRGPLPELTAAERALAQALQAGVRVLAGEIGERNVFRPASLARAASWIEASLAAAGHPVGRQLYDVDGTPGANLEAERRGASRPEEIVIVGARYDSVLGSPGANDNASGVAAVLALARAARGWTAGRTLRFVLFANEEPPLFQTERMGSLVYARRARARGERVVAMLSLETIGYYADTAGSQRYPIPLGWLYPTSGNFIAFVSDVRSRQLLREVVASFRLHARFPSEGAALPSVVPGVGWSDHWAFWQAGYSAVMVTDTALFRYPYYHSAADTPDKLDYERFARVVVGLARVVEDLANPA